MNTDKIRKMLGWSVVINIGLFGFSFLMFMVAGDIGYQFWSEFFSREAFNVMAMTTLGFWKIMIFGILVIPYFVLKNMEGKNRIDQKSDLVE